MNLIALLTTIFGTAMSFGYFSQVRRIIKTKSVKGVSFATYIFFTLGIAMWLVYGISIADLPIIISNSVFLIGALSVIVVYLIYRNK